MHFKIASFDSADSLKKKTTICEEMTSYSISRDFWSDSRSDWIIFDHWKWTRNHTSWTSARSVTITSFVHLYRKHNSLDLWRQNQILRRYSSLSRGRLLSSDRQFFLINLIDLVLKYLFLQIGNHIGFVDLQIKINWCIKIDRNQENNIRLHIPQISLDDEWDGRD